MPTISHARGVGVRPMSGLAGVGGVRRGVTAVCAAAGTVTGGFAESI
jgi:hypothetical protein